MFGDLINLDDELRWAQSIELVPISGSYLRTEAKSSARNVFK
jgi:hypothetical protein